MLNTESNTTSTTGASGASKSAGSEAELLAAAQKNDAVAQRKLGILIADYRWHEFFSSAAEQGDTYAQRFLANHYYDGCGVAQNYANAAMWFLKAAEQGDVIAQCDIAYCYAVGRGVEQDYTKAIKWWREAAGAGNRRAMENLAWCYAHGNGVEKNDVEAEQWRQKALGQSKDVEEFNPGCPAAKNRRGFGGSSIEDVFSIEGVKWLRLAAEQGDAVAQCKLADGYYYAAHRNMSCSHRNYVECVKWLSKAAEQGNSEAQRKLGWCYNRGKGVDKNKEEAIKWYRKSAEQGDEEARSKLEELLFPPPKQKRNAVKTQQEQPISPPTKPIAEIPKTTPPVQPISPPTKPIIETPKPSVAAKGEDVPVKRDETFSEENLWLRREIESAVTRHPGEAILLFLDVITFSDRALEHVWESVFDEHWAREEIFRFTLYFSEVGKKLFEFLNKTNQEDCAIANEYLAYQDEISVYRAIAIAEFRCLSGGCDVKMEDIAIKDERLKKFACEFGEFHKRDILQNDDVTEKTDFLNYMDYLFSIYDANDKTAITNEFNKAKGRWISEKNTAMPSITIFLGEDRKVPLELLYVPAGTFMMGDSTGNGYADEKPVHEVHITKPFWLGKTPVTNAQYKAVMERYPEGLDSGPYDWPVHDVSWKLAEGFCERLTHKRHGCHLTHDWEFALPTEAQWEYACRAGSTGDFAGDLTLRQPERPAQIPPAGSESSSQCVPNKYFQGNLDAMGWYGDDGYSIPSAVAQKQPNAWGFYDMHGNVWEWCSDYYAPYKGGLDINPEGELRATWEEIDSPSFPWNVAARREGARHVLRGGSFRDCAVDCRCAKRLAGTGPKDYDFENLQRGRGFSGMLLCFGMRVALRPRHMH